ncbi:MAG: hypothetical protein KDB10_05580 [Acidimicrobiales bacterium]|nr:hypothetical protein [Acidimicrobiales bacterium]MCB9371749.1 hypothetical protein [Microthrixaceae bacterium]
MSAGGWDDVLGQDRAVAQLRASVAAPVHAYLFVGPPGSGRRAAARAFAADLLAADSAGDDADRHRQLALAEHHPDLTVFVPEGASLREAEATEIIRAAVRAPVEGRRKVLVLCELHKVSTEAPKLLKTIEEPPPSTVFVILADDVPPELVTIASRAVRIDFHPVPEALVVDRLVAEGVAPAAAEDAARAASGDLDRARLLATDPELAERREAWRTVPDRLDGTGAAVMVAVDELRALIDRAQAPLTARHEREMEELAERVERYGQRGSGAAQLTAQHKREVRRARVDEVRLGLATLARRAADELAEARRPQEQLDRLAAIQAASEALVRNPNEALLLEDLLFRLSP